MSLTNDQVRHVAALARLELTEAEAGKYSAQLSSILDFIAQLNELDTKTVEATSHALDITNAWRADEARPVFEPGLWERNAPSADQGHLRVPKVLEG